MTEKRPTDEPLYYDYTRQCWVRDGRVLKCGHRQPMRLCYACQHAGETIPTGD